jgi:hypothetical protein
MTIAPAVATALPEFVAALAARDFTRLRETLSDGARVRALLPSGPVEMDGAEAVAATLERWFGAAEEFALVSSATERLADLLHVSYRLRLGDHPFRPGSGPQLIEQHLFCRLELGRVAAADLLCSGFRAEEGGA